MPRNQGRPGTDVTPTSASRHGLRVGVRVLAVGDLMLDRVAAGTLGRAPGGPSVPVLRVEQERDTLGGVGNVVSGLLAQAVSVSLVAPVGHDAAAAALTDLLREDARVESHLLAADGWSTPVMTRLVAGDRPMLRLVHARSAQMPTSLEAAVMAQAEANLRSAQAMVLSDHGRGALSDRVTRHLLAAAGSRSVPAIVDPHGSDYRRYRGARLLVVERGELIRASGLPAATDAEVIAAATALIRHAGIAAVLVTLGPDGMMLLRAGSIEAPLRLPATVREVVDASGTSETVVATVAAALAAGTGLAAACRLANRVGGSVVENSGAATTSDAELPTTVEANSPAAAAPGTATLSEAVARAAAWRDRGLKVGFTNGVFDLLHPGHVALLRQARAHCDRLIVGINSDASVRRLKGEHRPVQGDADRAHVLAAVAAVDLVVIFAEDTPFAVIDALRPDLLVKGADYTIDRVVGADLVRSYGGRVMLASLERGHSTTATIARATGQ